MQKLLMGGEERGEGILALESRTIYFEMGGGGGGRYFGGGHLCLGEGENHLRGRMEECPPPQQALHGSFWV